MQRGPCIPLDGIYRLPVPMLRGVHPSLVHQLIPYGGGWGWANLGLVQQAGSRLLTCFDRAAWIWFVALWQPASHTQLSTPTAQCSTVPTHRYDYHFIIRFGSGDLDGVERLGESTEFATQPSVPILDLTQQLILLITDGNLPTRHASQLGESAIAALLCTLPSADPESTSNSIIS